jgi:hypothetical protein
MLRMMAGGKPPGDDRKKRPASGISWEAEKEIISTWS